MWKKVKWKNKKEVRRFMQIHYAGYKCTDKIIVDKDLNIIGATDPNFEPNEIPTFFGRPFDPNAFLYEDREGNKMILAFKWSETFKAIFIRFFQAIPADMKSKTLRKLCNQVFDMFIWYLKKKKKTYIFAYAGWDYEQKDGGSFEQLAAYKQRADFWDIIGYHARKRGIEIKKSNKLYKGTLLRVFEIRYIKEQMFPEIPHANSQFIS